MRMNRPTLAVRSLLLAALIPATVAAGYQHGATRQLASRAVVVSATKSAAQIGAQNKPFVLGTVTNSLRAFDKAVRHRANVRIMFLRWGTPMLPAGTLTKTAALGAQTVIEIQPVHLNMVQIAAGVGDSWLRDVFATGVEALGHPVTVSFGPEMNGQWYPWGIAHNKPADFIAAWRHIHNLLSGTKAGQFLSWLWQPSAIHFSTASPKPWWPGSQYVDEVGLDGYYVLPNDTFDVIFAHTIRLVRSLTTRPILVGETAVGATTGRQVADIKNLFAGIRTYHLKGLIWFNIAQDGGKYHQDWRLQDHPTALRAFIASLNAAERPARHHWWPLGSTRSGPLRTAAAIRPGRPTAYLD
jgi:hypothetical protein